MGLRDQILSASDRPSEAVDCPEWVCKVQIGTMSGVERDALEVENLKSRGKDVSANMQNFRARLVCRTAFDDTGARIFTDADADELGKKSAMVLDRLYSVAARLNGYSKKDVEDIAKN